MSKKQKKILVRIILALIVGLIGYFIESNEIVKLFIFIGAYLIVGYDVLYSAITNIIHGNVFDEKFLMSIATIGAFFLRKYSEACGVMLFYQVGELFQSIAVGKSRKSISELMDIRPDTACVLKNGEEKTVSLEEVLIGETLLVKPGEKIPLDGIITSGFSSIDMSSLTGESIPVDVKPKDKVISGSINLSGIIKIQAETDYTESTATKILELVENASQYKAKSENFITRFARYYTPFIVFSALIIGIFIPLIWGDWINWITRALVFLVVSCPCALLVSVPLAFFGAIGRASRKGILIKGANYLELLSKCKVIAFDKTGTITKGCFEVNAIHPSSISEDELIDIAAACESYSSHPVAKSIISAHKTHIEKERISSVTEIAGKGLKAVIDNKTFYVGNSLLMDEIKSDWHNCHLTGTIIHISEENNYLGHIVISDRIKENSKEVINSLYNVGIKKCVMLTGDRKKVADSVAEEVGLNEVYSDLLPDKKVEIVDKLVSNDITAFVGDGINDAPVIKRADIGIAMGALGSDAAIESADIVLMDDNLIGLYKAIKISHKTMRIVKENIIFSLLIKFVILVLGLLGIANMWIAVFGDVGVMIIAILNSIRTLMK